MCAAAFYNAFPLDNVQRTKQKYLYSMGIPVFRETASVASEKIGNSPIKSDKKLGPQNVLRPSLKGQYDLCQNHGKWR